MAPLAGVKLQASHTLLDDATKVAVRQMVTTNMLTSGDNNNGSSQLDGGTIAAITIGSVMGFLLLLWLLRSVTNMGQPEGWGSTFGEYPEKVPRSSSSRHRRRHHHRSRASRGTQRYRPRKIIIQDVSTGRPRVPPPVYYSLETRGPRRTGDDRKVYKYYN